MLSERIRVNNSMLVDGYWAAELIDTSICRDLSNFFYNATNITECNVSNWDTSNVTSMDYVFANCGKLEEIDVSNWDVSKVVSCNSIFAGCKAVKELNTTNWNLKSNNIVQMFKNCEALEMVDASRLDVSNVTTLERVFSNCKSLKIIDVSKWDVSNVVNMTSTFGDCLSVNVLDVSNWDVSKVKRIDSIFYSCSELEMLDLTNWDVSNVENISFAFGACRKLSSLVGYRSIDEVITNNITALKGLKVSSYFSLNDTILDRASLRAVINGLADLTGQTAQKLTLGATLIAKLTDEDIAIATNKNWTIV
jgi:surface protein